MLRHNVRRIMMHSWSYRSLSTSLKIEPFSQPEDRCTRTSLLSLSAGQCLNDYSNEAHDREALTFVFYSAYIRVWWSVIVGRTSRIKVCSSLLNGTWANAGKRQSCCSVHAALFARHCARNARKSARQPRRCDAMRCVETHASWHKATCLVRPPVKTIYETDK